MAKQSVLKMSEFFLELFSEEIPANLQTNARKNLLKLVSKFILAVDCKLAGISSLNNSNKNSAIFIFDFQAKLDLHLLQDL